MFFTIAACSAPATAISAPIGEQDFGPSKTVVNFDGLPSDSGVTTQFRGVGVVFSNGFGGAPFVRSTGGARSAPLYLCPGAPGTAGEFNGEIVLTFTPPASALGADIADGRIGGDSLTVIGPGGQSETVSNAPGAVHQFVAVRPNFSIASARFNGGFYCIDDVTFETSPTADLSIDSAQAMQVVANADINADGRIDIVQGKPTVVRVRLALDDPQQLLDGSTNITTRVTYEGTDTDVTRTLDELRQSSFLMHVRIAEPRQLGDHEINVAVDPDDDVSETDETNNDMPSGMGKVTVKATRALSVVALPVECDSGDIVSDYAGTVHRGAAYTTSLFPIAPSAARFQTTATPFVCELPLPAATSTVEARINYLNKEGVNLWIQGKLQDGFAERVVGVTSDAWMNRAFSADADGATPGCPYIGASFVRDGRWVIVAHELGHTYQLQHPPGSPGCGGPLGVGSTAGFWVEPPGFPDGFETGGRSIMDEPPSPAPAFPFSLRWIAADDYERLFREFRLSAVDPEILLVGGILRASGQVEWARSYRLPQGIIDRAPAGPMSLRVLDASGGILYRLAFGRDTRTAGPSGDIPFAFAVPFAPGAETVELTMDSVVRGDFRIASRLLRDVVSAIPDYGFDRNPSQRRGVLLNKIDVLETQLKAGARQGARDKLRNDIRKHLAEWLVDDYTTDSPLKYEKAAVLKLVDELIQRLGG